MSDVWIKTLDQFYRSVQDPFMFVEHKPLSMCQEHVAEQLHVVIVTAQSDGCQQVFCEGA